MTSEIYLNEATWTELATGDCVIGARGRIAVHFAATQPTGSAPSHDLVSTEDNLEFTGSDKAWGRALQPGSVALVSGNQVRPSAGPVATLAPTVTVQPSLTPAQPTEGDIVVVATGAATGTPPPTPEVRLVVAGQRVRTDAVPVRMPRAGAWSLTVLWRNRASPNALATAFGTVLARTPSGPVTPAPALGVADFTALAADARSLRFPEANNRSMRPDRRAYLNQLAYFNPPHWAGDGSFGLIVGVERNALTGPVDYHLIRTSTLRVSVSGSQRPSPLIVTVRDGRAGFTASTVTLGLPLPSVPNFMIVGQRVSGVLTVTLYSCEDGSVLSTTSTGFAGSVSNGIGNDFNIGSKGVLTDVTPLASSDAGWPGDIEAVWFSDRLGDDTSWGQVALGAPPEPVPLWRGNFMAFTSRWRSLPRPGRVPTFWRTQPPPRRPGSSWARPCGGNLSPPICCPTGPRHRRSGPGSAATPPSRSRSRAWPAPVSCPRRG